MIGQENLSTTVRAVAVCHNTRPDNKWQGAIWSGAGNECVNPLSITPSDAYFVGDLHANGTILSGEGTKTFVEGFITCSGGNGCVSGGFYNPDSSVLLYD
jgi:hypothetical protein